MKKYIEPSLEEGQLIRELWERVTVKPLTPREIDFAREIASYERRQAFMNCNSPILTTGGEK